MAPPSRVDIQPTLTSPGVVIGAGLQTMVQSPSSDAPTVTPMASGEVFPGGEVQNFTSTSNLSSASQINFGPGKTLIVIFDDAASVEGATLLGSGQGAVFAAGRKGWSLQHLSAYWCVVGGATDITGVGITDVAGASLVSDGTGGLKTLAIRWSVDNHVSFSVGGQPVVDYGTVMVPGAVFDGTCSSVLGAALPGDTVGSAFVNGGLLAFAIVNAAYTDQQLIAASNAGKKNRLRLPASVVADADATVLWEADVDWDGTSATTTTRGSAPVTFTVNGAPGAKPTLLDVTEIRLLPTPETQLDASAPIPGSGFTWFESFSKRSFFTDSVRLGVDISCNGVAQPVGLFSNGTYLGHWGTGVSSGITPVDVQLPAGAQKRVDVMQGQQTWPGGFPPLANNSAYIEAVRIRVRDAYSVVQKSRPRNRLVCIGDSIADGYIATNPLQNAFLVQLRGMLSNAAVTAFAWGGQNMKQLTDGTYWTNSSFAALLATMLDGTYQNTLLLETVTNDYASNIESPANHASRVDALLTALESMNIPGFKCIILGAFQRIAPATEAANGLGATLGDYRTARAGVAALNPQTRSFYIGNNIVSNANMFSDGVHLTAAGNAQVAAWAKPVLAFS